MATIKSAAYFYQDDSLGVANKINGQLAVLNNYFPNPSKIRFNKLGEFRTIIKQLQPCDVIYIRYFTRLIWFYPWLSRLKGKIILEIPTPIAISVNECSGSRLKYHLRRALFRLSFPRLFNLATSIVEYAQEEPQFIGNNKLKINYINNGIDINLYPTKWPDFFAQKQLVNRQSLQSKQLQVLIVANLAFWHGLDRFINGLKNYYSSPNGSSSEFEVFLHIVGDGNDSMRMQRLSQELGLKDKIIFHGKKSPVELEEFYLKAHCGIGSLGNFRKGIHAASMLKVREYCLFGLPFLLDGNDSDFSQLDWFYPVTASDEAININSIIAWYLNLNQQLPTLARKMHQYAVNNLSWHAKLAALIAKVDR